MCHPEVPAGAPIPDVRIEEATIPVEGRAAMPGLLAFPERTPAPGILIVNDVFGRSPFYDNLARRLAQAGFVAVTPEYFFREGAPPEPTREAAMERAKKLDFKRWGRDMSAAIDWLGSHRDVKGTVGTIGFCMGGTMVLLLAARKEGIAATVSYYGFPADARTDASPVDLAPKMRGPILGHWGEHGDVGRHARREALEEFVVERAERDRLPDARPSLVPGLDTRIVAEVIADRTLPRFERGQQTRVRERIGLEVEPELDHANAAPHPYLVMQLWIAEPQLRHVGVSR